jgi:hypothetical protein
MKKTFLILALISLVFSVPVYAADQWAKIQPAGTEAAGTIDDLLRVNNAALDRLEYNYRRSLTVVPDTGNTVNVLAGEIAIPNAAGSVVRWRMNTTTTNLTWSDIDTGAEANGAQYYVYAVADTDATTCTFLISTNATSPTGATYYRKIGYFYNDSTGAIVSVGNIKGGDVPNIISQSAATEITTSSASFVDMTDMKLYLVTSGRPVMVVFHSGLFQVTGSINYNIVIDSVQKIQGSLSTTSGGSLAWEGVLASGAHTVTVQWSSSGGTSYQWGTTGYSGTMYGERIIIAEEL